MTLCKDGFEENNENEKIVPGTLPDDIEISKSSEDLLKRLLQPDPRARLKSVYLLQRIAFFMGHDIQSYKLKKISPFRLLGKTLQDPARSIIDPFRDFDSFIGGSTNRRWN
ncbi:serine/threonine-protein kinase S6KL-like [Aphidius gifuensis]|nr:serine/threonine-protein kinase S6KL-like [Aphidius gifuensis]